MLLGNRRAWNDTPLAVPARVPCLGFVSSRARGRRLGKRFRFGGAGASYGDFSARADRNRRPRGGRVNHTVRVSSRAREGGPSASGFDAGDAELWGRLRREPIETAGRGAQWRVCALAFQAG